MDLIGWIFAPVALTMLIERGDVISRWLIERSANAFPENIREAFREEWLADLALVDGKIWKLWHGFGIFIRCLPAIVHQGVRKHLLPRSAGVHDTRFRSLRSLRKKFSEDAWQSLLNAAEMEADAYRWRRPEYRVEFIENFIIEHGVSIGAATESFRRSRNRRAAKEIRRSKARRRH